MKKKTLAIFGCTGSIGNSALKVYLKNKGKFNLLYLSAHTNYKKLNNIKSKFKPKKIFLSSQKYSASNIFIDNLFKNKKKIDYVITGVSGYEALEFNFNLLKISKNLLIANKETIICGGKFFLNKAKNNNCKIIPIDSEHHCIDLFLNTFDRKKNIRGVYLTASGGPFLNKKFKYNEKISSVTKHPTWKMGKEISVNSSTLANKILELFEAKILFNIPSNHLKIIIDSKSNTHALFEFKNNIYISIIHKPSMEIPISNSLNISKLNKKIDFCNLNSNLVNVDLKKFPLVKLGYYILNNCNEAGYVIFTILNERLVKKYIENKIKYGEIIDNLISSFKDKKILKKSKNKLKNIKDIYKIIKYAKELKI